VRTVAHRGAAAAGGARGRVLALMGRAGGLHGGCGTCEQDEERKDTTKIGNAQHL